MKNIFVKLPLFAVFGMATCVLSADCLPDAPDPYSKYAVPYTLVTLKNYASGNAVASYVAGQLRIGNFSDLFASGTTYSNNSFNGDPQLFSDRLAGSQPFDIYQTDQLGVSITKSFSVFDSGPSITVKLTLKSWGNGVYSFPATCDASTGELVGSIEGNTYVVITLGTPHEVIQ